jgi:hypothetical protein
MKLLILFLLCVTATILTGEEINISKPIPELILRNGRSYKNVSFVSYAVNVVSVKWDGGAGTIAYDLLPDGVRKAAEAKRPKAETSRKKPPTNTANKQMKPRGPYYLEGRVLSKADGIILIDANDPRYWQTNDRSNKDPLTGIVALKGHTNYAEVAVRDWLQLSVMRIGDHDSEYGQVPLIRLQ